MNKKIVSLLSSCGLILTALIWGFAFVVVKDSLDFVPPVYMVALRYTIAAVILGVILFAIGKLKILNKSYWVHGIITGLMLGSAYIVQTIGCNYTTAGKNAFLTTVYVILIPLIMWPMYKKRPGWIVFLSAFIALVGIGMLTLTNDGSSLSVNIGDILTLICGLLFALQIIFTSKYSQDENPVVLSWIQFVTSAVLAWICSPFIDGAFEFAVLKSSKVLLSIFYLGIFSSLIAFLLQNVCLKYVVPSLASLFLSLESVFGILSSVIFLHERLTVVMIAGCVLIFAAITIADQFGEKK